jgi:hypothetical protein
LARILALSNPIAPFDKVFEEISKNNGISLISFDPSESEIQLFHHNQIIGGSWENPKKLLASIHGFDNSTRPIQIVLKSIEVVKAKTPSFTAAVDPESAKNPLEDAVDSKKTKKIEFHHRNILPIPHVLTKAFLKSTTFDPLSVAQAFYKAMLEFDLKQSAEKNETETEINGCRFSTQFEYK